MRYQPGKHENPGANYRSDPQRRQLKWPKCFLQAMFAVLLGFGEQHVHRFLRKQGVAHATPPFVAQRSTIRATSCRLRTTLYVSFRAQRGISVPPPATSYLA